MKGYPVLSSSRDGQGSELLRPTTLFVDDLGVEELLEVRDEYLIIKHVVHSTTIDSKLKQTMDKLPRNGASALIQQKQIFHVSIPRTIENKYMYVQF